MSLSFVVEVLERVFSWFWKISSLISFISTILFLLHLHYILPIPCYLVSKLYMVPLRFDVLLKHRGGSNKRTIASSGCREVLRGGQGLREQDLGFPLLGTHWLALYHYTPSSKFTNPPFVYFYKCHGLFPERGWLFSLFNANGSNIRVCIFSRH